MVAEVSGLGAAVAVLFWLACMYVHRAIIMRKTNALECQHLRHQWYSALTALICSQVLILAHWPVSTTRGTGNPGKSIPVSCEWWPMKEEHLH